MMKTLKNLFSLIKSLIINSEDTYFSISQPSEGLFKDRGSKFIAYAHPVISEAEIKQILEFVRSEHQTARHFCYAYKLGHSGDVYRANDDGEPSGSAGKPILGQLTKYNLTDILIVVVRYFGGTKLGVGGLINAYKIAAAESIKQSEIIKKTVSQQFQLTFPYERLKGVEQMIKKLNIEIIERDFRESCQLTCAIRLGDFQIAVQTFRKMHGVEFAT